MVGAVVEMQAGGSTVTDSSATGLSAWRRGCDCYVLGSGVVLWLTPRRRLQTLVKHLPRRYAHKRDEMGYYYSSRRGSIGVAPNEHERTHGPKRE